MSEWNNDKCYIRVPVKNYWVYRNRIEELENEVMSLKMRLNVTKGLLKIAQSREVPLNEEEKRKRSEREYYPFLTL